MEEKKYYTLSEVAAITKLTDRTLRNYLANGTLKGCKCGGQWRFSQDDIHALFQTETYNIKRIDDIKSNIDKYVEGKISFENSRSALLIVDFNDLKEEQVKRLVKHIKALPKDADVKESVYIHEENYRVVFIASFEHIAKICDVIREV